MVPLTTAKLEKLSRDEIIALIENGSRRRLNLSAYDFVAQYQKGRLEDPAEVADLVVFLDLLTEDDPIFNGRA